MTRVLLVSLVVLLSLTSFAKQEQSPKRLKVVTTLQVLGDIAKQVGKDRIEVSSLAQPNQDPHFVIPTPTLMKKTRDADVFVENGLSLELWAQKVVDGAGNKKIQLGQPGRIVASRGVSTLEVPQVLSRQFGDVHPGGNPHVWLDPLNAKIMAKNISDGLSKVDPSNASFYVGNLKAFENLIDAKMADWQNGAAKLKGAKIITYHKSFIYFANRFGFTIPAEIEEKPGISPSARYRDSLINLVRKEKISTIVLELYYDRVAPDFIASKTGARVVQVPIDVGADPKAMDYFSLIDLMIERLTQKSR